MKKLMLIAIVGMFAVTAFAAPPSGGKGPSGGGGRGPSGNPGRVEHKQPAPPPRHDRGISDDLAKARAITGIVRDSLGILGIGSPRYVVPAPPPSPRVIVTPAPVYRREVIVTTPSPVVQEVVVEKPVVVEKIVKPEVKKIEPVILGDHIYYMITFTDGTVKTILAE